MTTTDLTLLRRAAEALIDIGKKALVVKTTLNKPYPDAPSETPWSRYMEQPARRAYNLGHEIRRAVLALAETPDWAAEVDLDELESEIDDKIASALADGIAYRERALREPQAVIRDDIDDAARAVMAVLANYYITPRETR